MKASELIKMLGFAIAESGDLEVTLFTDHGQTQSPCQSLNEEVRVIEDEEQEGVYVIEIYGE